MTNSNASFADIISETLDKRPIYVIDTNVLVDYPDIIPSDENWAVEESSVDLSNAHLVIPTAVTRELSSFKNEHSDRGKTARVVLKHLRQLIENHGCIWTMEESYLAKQPITLQAGNQLISILPIHKNFTNCLPFKPSSKDMDAQIILAAIVAACCENDIAIDGSATENSVNQSLKNNSVTLLTNDNGLAIRARARGLKTARYSYKPQRPYQGRRDLVVPSELFKQFYTEGIIEQALWEELMPSEPPLVANEFIIMTPEDNAYPRGYTPTYDPDFSYIGRFDPEQKALTRLKYLRNFPISPRNPGQAIYAESLADPNIDVVICTGPAGTGKTYMATIYAYWSCKEGQFIGATVIPCQVKDDGVGYLPGDMEEKLDPNVQPIKNALRNFLLDSDKQLHKQRENMLKFGANEAGKSNDRNASEQGKKSIKARLRDSVDLIWDNWFESKAIAYTRGCDFSEQIALYDEFQDQNHIQADTLLKRLGKNGKIIITGDIEQIHSAYLDRENNGLTFARRLTMDAPMVAQVTFTENEVVRHPFVRFIAQKQQSSSKN